ncbi:hypothetical protein AALB53_20055, partial [Lachnospiraceae bacterium 47-T17]
FFFLSAINLHFFFGVFLHFIIGANTHEKAVSPGVQAGATKKLKAHDPLRLAGLMNTCKAQIEEIILNELIWD